MEYGSAEVVVDLLTNHNPSYSLKKQIYICMKFLLNSGNTKAQSVFYKLCIDDPMNKFLIAIKNDLQTYFYKLQNILTFLTKKEEHEHEDETGKCLKKDYGKENTTVGLENDALDYELFLMQIYKCL